jgi:parallel beta-helix repeat protein
VTIGVSDVNFDMNGHSISAPGIAMSVGDGTGSDANIAVTGPGSITGTGAGSYGLYVNTSAVNSGVDGVTLFGQTWGALMNGNASTAANRNYVRNSTFGGNNSGILMGSGANEISDSTCSGGAGGAGIYTQNSANNLVQDNTCTGYATGIYLSDGSTGNVVTGNTMTGNTYRDAADFNTNCAGNTWSQNTFGTVYQGCENNDPAGAGPVCTITGTAGPDRLRGTSGDDVICGLGGDDVLDGRGGNDEIYGGDGNDEVIGKGGNDKLFGGDGVDLLLPGSGNDTADGGASVRDRVLYSDITGGGVNVFLSSGAVSPEAGSNVGSDQLSNIEQVFGSEFDDILVAQIAGVASTVKGGGGDDHLDTDDGDGLDAMVGNAGSDICAGNPGDRIAEC